MKRRQLIVMRHATASSGGGHDHARTLTEYGREEAERVGLLLRSLGPIPERVLCSSATRCRETWQAVSSALGSTAEVDFEDGLYNASSASIANCLAGVVEEERVLLIAHNPGVGDFALDLGRGDPESETLLRAGFTPAATACFEIEGNWAGVSAATARLTRFERAPNS